MNYFSIAFKIIALVSFVVLITLSRKSVDEAETVYRMYRPMHNEIAGTECYKTLDEPLKVQMLKVENEVNYHSLRIENYQSFADGLTAFCFLLAVVFTFLEIRGDKKKQDAPL